MPVEHIGHVWHKGAPEGGEDDGRLRRALQEGLQPLDEVQVEGDQLGLALPEGRMACFVGKGLAMPGPWGGSGTVRLSTPSMSRKITEVGASTMTKRNRSHPQTHDKNNSPSKPR